MARYPRNQAALAALVESMLAGFAKHPADFPHSDPAALQSAMDEYKAADNVLLDVKGQMAIAAGEKLKKYNQLKSIAKKQIRLCEVDCAGQPVKLNQIGWGPRKDAEPLEPPAQPLGLKATAADGESVFLSWQKNNTNGSGPVRAYIIERRQKLSEGEFDKWQLSGTCLNTEFELKEQPNGCKLEYRIRAINSSGESPPSNTVCVVL
jgi:hypothetical protein